MVATVRCEEIAYEKLANVTANEVITCSQPVLVVHTFKNMVQLLVYCCLIINNFYCHVKGLD